MHWTMPQEAAGGVGGKKPQRRQSESGPGITGLAAIAIIKTIQ